MSKHAHKVKHDKTNKAMIQDTEEARVATLAINELLDEHAGVAAAQNKASFSKADNIADESDAKSAEGKYNSSDNMQKKPQEPSAASGTQQKETSDGGKKDRPDAQSFAGFSQQKTNNFQSGAKEKSESSGTGRKETNDSGTYKAESSSGRQENSFNYFSQMQQASAEAFHKNAQRMMEQQFAFAKIGMDNWNSVLTMLSKHHSSKD